MVITLTTSIVGNAVNNADAGKLKTKGEQNQLADIQPDGRKKLKQKIKLEYTHPDFEKTLDDSQKEAIIKSLKKWKLDLPVNNTFTVTSIGNFKDPNNKVIYMWASTPNQDWDKSKVPSGEDFESGDPRFVRTEFNVLLNKAPKKAWKATIEQDNELKTELSNIAESEISTDEKNILFGANKAGNQLTANTEILVDSNSETSSSSTISSAVSTVQSSSSSTTSGLSTSTNSVSTNATTSISSSSKTISFLDSLFRTVKASAGVNDYSWPWANGVTYNVNTNYGWHTDAYDGTESLATGNRALDISIPGNTAILAPITGVAYRKCTDQNNSTFVIRSSFTANNTYGGNGMRLVHLTPNTSFDSAQPNISYTKGQQIGTVKLGLQSNDYGCGYGFGDHLHLKFLANNMNVDGTTVTYSNNYNSFTSNIGATVTPPPTPTSSKFNIRRTGTSQCINSYLPANNKALDTWTCDATDPEETWEQVPLTGGFSLKRKNTNFCIDAANPQTDGKVNTYTCNNTDSQKFQYDSSTKKFYRVGASNNNQCVAKGSPGNGLLIKMYDCASFNDNFKWDFVPV
jgi:Ricin-type beta-trefoil lectin domain